jgi:hypothetical protein
VTTKLPVKYLVPFGQLFVLGREQGVDRIQDFDRVDLISLADLVSDVNAWRGAALQDGSSIGC